ncbi:acyltransferase family protein [Jannaschia sp. 2305UL9-9]|uniref:acyltransferase family protein n=1 Tax=Jannaschia sp. 2305UL9-9 TaxID=3121638 RepID=UPI003527CCC9
MTEKDRFAAVDGLRMVAILWVAIYHYAVFWTPAGKGDNLIPYGDALAWIPLAAVGGLGVSLFFIISGFVITLSLDRCENLRSFAALRVLRLWPTLFVCATLTFVVTSLFGPAELSRDWVEYLISLTFVPPLHAGKIIGLSDLQWLDGAYWSLWVEVRFYAIAAVLHFGLRRHFLVGWACFAGATAMLHLFLLPEGHAVLRLLFSQYQPFFTMGIALAAVRANGAGPLPVALFAAGFLQAFAYAAPSADVLVGLSLVCLGAPLVILSRRRIPVLSATPVARAGRASYAYYLLHQNIGLALLFVLAPADPVLAIGVMLTTQIAILAFSVWYTEVIEMPLLRRLRGRVRRPDHRPVAA